MFLRSGYWGWWSRVLSENHPKGPFIEVNLTPIPDSHDSTWAEDVAPIRIRAHGTARDYRKFGGGDTKAEQLPEDVRQAMIRNLGAKLTARLLTEDFLSQINWDLYQQKCNGGANLEDVRLRLRY